MAALILSLCLGLLAYLLQTQFYLEGDVIYLIHAAGQLLQGGNYLENFFETNPPLIFYLYFPVIFCVHFLKINLVAAARIYVIGLSLLALFASDYFIKRSRLDTKARYSLLAAIALVLLFLPLCEFAQREHFLMIFTMPYWFLLQLRMEKKPVSAGPAFCCGLAAGLGFALKPFFLLPLLMIEAGLCVRERNPFFIFRKETLSIFVIFILYGLTVFIFQPDYLHIILPLVSKYYFSGAAEHWSSLLDRPPAVFCFVVALFTPFFYKMLRNNELGLLFSLALLGFILCFMLPKTAWYYHVLPALSMCILLGALVIAELPSKLMGAGLALVFLLIPTLFSIRVFYSDYAIRHNQALNELIEFANSRHSRESGNLPSKEAEDSRFRGNDREPTVYCIPSHHACSILSAYGNAQYASRFPSFWALRGILNKQPSPESNADTQFILALLIEDLDQKKPDLVIFDNSIGLRHLKSSQDYIAYFSRHSAFNALWAQYHYVKRIGSFEIYQKSFPCSLSFPRKRESPDLSSVDSRFRGNDRIMRE